MRRQLPLILCLALSSGGCAAVDRPDRLVGAGEGTLRHEWGDPPILGERSGDEGRYGPWGNAEFAKYEWPSSRMSYYIYPDRGQTAEVQHGRVLAIRELNEDEQFAVRCGKAKTPKDEAGGP